MYEPHPNNGAVPARDRGLLERVSDTELALGHFTATMIRERDYQRHCLTILFTTLGLPMPTPPENEPRDVTLTDRGSAGISPR